MPEDERPREKLAAHGASSLSDAELIAILLRTGVTGKNVVDLARELLQKFGSLNELSRCGGDEMKKNRGNKRHKGPHLVARVQLGQRVGRETVGKPKNDSPEVVNQLVGREMRMLRKEAMRVILMDTRYQLIRIEDVSS